MQAKLSSLENRIKELEKRILREKEKRKKETE